MSDLVACWLLAAGVQLFSVPGGGSHADRILATVTGKRDDPRHLNLIAPKSLDFPHSRTVIRRQSHDHRPDPLNVTREAAIVREAGMESIGARCSRT